MASTRTVLFIGTAAGLIGGAVELVPILPIQGALGVSPLRVFQSIASGLLGRDAYGGGWGSGLLGIACHFLIAVGAGVAYALAASRMPLLRRRPLAMGALYGVAVYAFMNWVVVPLSAVAFAPTSDPAMMALSLAIHILAFTIPIALVVRRRLVG